MMVLTLTSNEYTAKIDTLGAQLISFKDPKGLEYIWQRDPKVWARCSPLLFPAIGNCRNGKTIFAGRTYEMPKHGFCRDMDFLVSEQTEDSVLLTVASNAFTKEHYPYDFRLSLRYSLKDGLLSIEYLVENQSGISMGYCLGAHPGFRCPFCEGESYEDYQLIFEQKETCTARIYDIEALEFEVELRGIRLDNTSTLPLSRELFASDAVYFDDLRSRSVALVHAQKKTGVQVSFPGFSSVAFWTPCTPQASLLCIEPWNGSAIRADEDDHFLHRHQVEILNPGAKRTHLLQIRISYRSA